VGKKAKIHACFPLLPLFLALFLASCATTPEAGDPESFSFLERKELIPAAGAKENKAEMSFSLIDVSRSGALQKLVRNTLYGGKSAEEYLQRIAKKWEKEYGEFVREGNPFGVDWYYEEVHNLLPARPFAIIKKTGSFYQGGAHPFPYEKSFLLDLSAPVKRLGLKDVFTVEGLEKLSVLIDRALRRYSQTATGKIIPAGIPLSRGIYYKDEAPPPEDFYPDVNGLNFRWNPYEIAPYAAGFIEISIQWDELTELLTPKGKEMAAIFKAKK